DLELGALFRARAVEALAEDPITRTVLVALPHHDEVTREVHPDARRVLVTGRIRIDAELAPLGHAGAVEALREDVLAKADLIPALPDDHEVSAHVHRDAGIALVPGRICIDLELAALFRARRVVALPEHAPLETVLTGIARPHHDKIPRGICRDLREILARRRVRIGLEFRGERGRLRAKCRRRNPA